jgi:hypothetical protein
MSPEENIVSHEGGQTCTGMRKQIAVTAAALRIIIE